MNDNFAERSVIGALLIDMNCMQLIYNDLRPEMFTDTMLRNVYTEVVKAYDVGKQLSVVNLSQSLESSTYTREMVINELKGCMDTAITTQHIRNYADVMIKDYKSLRLKQIISQIKPLPDNIDSQMGMLINKLEALMESKKSNANILKDIVEQNCDQYFKENGDSKLLTGFNKLDDITGGLEGGDVIILGARPAVGKSAFVSQIVISMAKQKKKIGFYNLEMADKQIYERFLSNESGIGVTRIRRAKDFLGDEKDRFNSANKVLSELNIMISSGTKSVGEIRNECRHMELDCIVIDYLQLLKSDIRYQNRASEVGAISKAIKSLAMELNIPVIALSQLNRISEMKDTKEPSMSELREAGDIEQDASIIMLMWNLDNDNREKKALKVDKNRQGELGTVVFNFNGNEMRFIESEETIKQAMDGFKPVKISTPFD